jgi:phosphomannomutase
LNPASQAATAETLAFLRSLRGIVSTGMVGGSDLSKQKEQLGEDVLHLFDYVFPENGLLAFRDGALVGQTSFREHLGEARLKEFINFTLAYLATVDVPVKRGTFIEFRSGMLNVSPVGRNCSQAERDAFEEFDRAHGVRATMVAVLQERFKSFDLKFSIGGQISFDVFPRGWDKTYCLRYLEPRAFREVHFFGDKTFEGGNDFEIFSHPAVKGHTVVGPADTEAQCRALFGLQE